jgi:hypothetical protein
MFCKEVFTKFAYWIVYVHKSPATKQHLMMGTVLNYIGKIMTLGKDTLFKGDAFFDDVDEEKENWYSEMRCVQRHMVTYAIDNAEVISEKPPSVGRKVMAFCCEAYFKKGTRESIFRRAVLNTLHSASGRESEAQGTTMNCYEVCHILNMCFYDWRMRKTSGKKGVGFVTDFDNPYLDHYHAMGCLLMIGEGQDDHQRNGAYNHWVFPRIKDLAESGGAKKVSGYLQDLLPFPASKSVEFRDTEVRELPLKVVSGSALSLA